MAKMFLRKKGGEVGGRVDFAQLRRAMVDEQIERRGVKDQKVLSAMRSVPRHEFVPADQVRHAYEDRPLPIGENQTISQPYIVALMTELLDLEGVEKVLEVGTGSGYQAAVLAEIVPEVYTIEILKTLLDEARQRFVRLCYRNIHTRNADAYNGWPEEAPFDRIVVTAASKKVPEPLTMQLIEGGRLVMPVGKFYQELIVLEKRDGLERRRVISVRFVPMTGLAEEIEDNEE